MADPSLLSLPDASGATLALVAAIAFLGGVIGTMSGAGTGFLIAIFIAPVVGVKAVVPVLSITSIVVNLSRVWVFRSAFSRRVAGHCALAAVPGAVAGASLYSWLSEEGVSALLGLFLLSAVLIRRAPARWLARSAADGGAERLLGRRGLFAGSFLAGTFVGAVPGAGIVMVSLLLAAGLRGVVLLGTEAAIALTMGVTKTVVFSGYALLTPGLAVAGALIGLCTIPGTYLARAAVERIPLKAHTLLLDVVVVGGGLNFLWRALKGTGLV
ncbi:MAG: sulfite exporter TauE/SafE family protein [Proteobacteria bacterium]|nr:sulfite exporter TauE/SafE family protein [Pseudomonadota bacterium]